MITISNKFKLTVRVICLVLVLCICLSVVLSPKAYAISELVIVGALALTITACAAVVIIAAEPLGLKDTIVSAAQHGFQTPREFVASLLERYGASKGLQQFVLMDKFQKGVLVTAAGKMLIDATFSNWLKDFFDWSWSEEGGGLINFASYVGDTTISFDTSNISNAPFDILNFNLTGIQKFKSGNSLNIENFSESAVCVRWNNKFGWFSKNESYYMQQNISTGQLYGPYNLFLSTKTYGGVTWSYYNQGPWSWTYGDNTGLTASTIGNLPNGLSDYDAIGFIIASSIWVTDGVIAEPNTGELTLPAPDSYNNFDVPGALTLPAPINGTTTATNYLEAAADAITVGTGSLEYEDAGGIERTGTLEGTDTVGLTQVGAQSAELEGSIEIADSIGSPTLDNYSLDLKNFFPFCIPFDLRDMLKLIKSAPAPVSVQWTFDFGDLGTQVLEIDLQVFDSLAQTLRSMELLAFCVGLALATKRLLMGS